MRMKAKQSKSKAKAKLAAATNNVACLLACLLAWNTVIEQCSRRKSNP